MSVYVFNNAYQFVGVTSWKRAIRMIFLDKAEPLLNTDEELCPGFLKPKAIRLYKAIRRFFGKEVAWSKRNVITRDKCTCAYCGTKLPATQLTIDHITPQCNGGKSTWENTVAACKPCNNYKDNKTLQEAGMFFHKGIRPYAPTIAEFMAIKFQEEGIADILSQIMESYRG